MITAGIDIGSLTADAVILRDNAVIGYKVVPTGASSENAARVAYDAALESAKMTEADVEAVAATGYGRSSVPFTQRTITEITCHAVGTRSLFRDAASVVDIGGQDSKVIRLSADGRVEDFAMNDKCAAGTGRFLEVMAAALETDLELLGELSARSTERIRISSTCTVFAESEVVALVARGVPKEDIIRGLHEAIAERIYSMVRRLRAAEPFVMTGGVAKNKGVVRAIESRLGTSLRLPEEPQIVGALGAAIMARSGGER
ncbi:MAG: 2-hydroxyglutaryl-CoA dehydratase [Armatimonadetes bacterium]|nr:2-hydroxyglutaryl-CoA dehydratase [Armatimonadota bacterium]